MFDIFSIFYNTPTQLNLPVAKTETSIMLRRVVTRTPRSVALPLRASSCVIPSRHFSSTIARMSLPPVTPPVSAVLPSDSFQLLPEAEKPGAAEDALYEQQIKDVEAWWATPRYEGIRRPYTAADVVSKRGSQMQSYPSSVMARKLFNLIKERGAKGEPIHTSTLDAACSLGVDC